MAYRLLSATDAGELLDRNGTSATDAAALLDESETSAAEQALATGAKKAASRRRKRLFRHPRKKKPLTRGCGLLEFMRTTGDIRPGTGHEDAVGG